MCDVSADEVIDPYWLHPESAGVGPVQAGANRGNVCSSATSPGTTHQTSGISAFGSAQASGSGGGDGVQSSLHGHAGGTEDHCDDYNQLHVGLYAFEREDEG
jgi:hypothetical protein